MVEPVSVVAFALPLGHGRMRGLIREGDRSHEVADVQARRGATPTATNGPAGAISSDGRLIAFVGCTGGQPERRGT